MEKENWTEKIVYLAVFLVSLHFIVATFTLLYQKAINPNLFNNISFSNPTIITVTFLLFFKRPLINALISSFYFYALIVLLISFFENFHYMINSSGLGPLESWTGIILPLFLFFVLLYYFTNSKKKIIKTRHYTIDCLKLRQSLSAQKK
jgi:hypothetical protein